MSTNRGSVLVFNLTSINNLSPVGQISSTFNLVKRNFKLSADAMPNPGLYCSLFSMDRRLNDSRCYTGITSRNLVVVVND